MSAILSAIPDIEGASCMIHKGYLFRSTSDLESIPGIQPIKPPIALTATTSTHKRRGAMRIQETVGLQGACLQGFLRNFLRYQCHARPWAGISARGSIPARLMFPMTSEV
jgi:hypothetical protein